MKQQSIIKKTQNKFIIVSTLLIIIMLLSACGKNVQSTDLSKIEFDGMKIGDIVHWEDFSNYTYISKNHYEEITIDTDVEDNIIYLFSYFSDNKHPGVTISINGTENSKTIDDITNLLGNHYTAQPEQGNLSKHIYFDAEREIRAEFIYNNQGKALRYIRISNSALYE
ncbi:MAG: hypothetical protein ACOX6U_03235 [Oscillospiraceae bacterium]|jgi:hypothetical protein